MADPADAGRVLDADDHQIGEEAGDASDERTRMSFLDHLDELRRRIVLSLYAILAACIVAFIFWQQMYVYMVGYFGSFGGQIIYNRPMGAFMFSMKLGLLAGLIAASPFVFSQLWLFVAPGLYKREKRIIVPFVFFSSLLFGAGAYFAHRIAFPAMWTFFASYEDLGGMKFFPSIDETFALYVKVILGLGLIFQMPLLVFGLSKFGLISARFLIKHFKYAVLFIFIIAAIITPSADVATLLVFVAPMLVLYLVSIGVAWIFGRKQPGKWESDD